MSTPVEIVEPGPKDGQIIYISDDHARYGTVLQFPVEPKRRVPIVDSPMALQYDADELFSTIDYRLRQGRQGGRIVAVHPSLQ